MIYAVYTPQNIFIVWFHRGLVCWLVLYNMLQTLRKNRIVVKNVDWEGSIQCVVVVLLLNNENLIKVFSFSWGPPLKQEDEWQSPRSVVQTNWDATSERFRVVPSIKIITAVALAMTSWTELQKTSFIWHYHPCKDFWKVSPSCARGLSSYFQWQVMGGGKWQLKSSHFPPFSCSIPKLWLWNLRASVNECRTQSTQMFRLQIIWSLSLSVSWFS